MLKYFFHTFGSGTALEPQTLSYGAENCPKNVLFLTYIAIHGETK